MRITKKISRRMVEAKRRIRIQRSEADPIESNGKVFTPRKPAAKWTIEIRDGEHGDRVRLTLHRSPWPHQWLAGPELVSSATIAKRIQTLITHAA